MTATLAAYPAYQDSGVPRLGRILAHWEVNSACHNQVISTLLRQIALLREYRTRHLADVVTWPGGCAGGTCAVAGRR